MVIYIDLKTRCLDEVKFVDDLTVYETVTRFGSSDIQYAVSEIEEWSESNLFRLNENKCKELRIDFAKNRNPFPPIKINGKPLQVVEEAKLLGLTIANNLKWNSHVNNIVTKSSKRIYLLVQLKRAKVAIQDVLQFYTVCIRPILEYASTVFHYSLPKYLNNPNHKLHNLIPKIDTSLNYQLRNNKKIHVPKFYTERFKNSYVFASCLDINNRNSTN